MSSLAFFVFSPLTRAVPHWHLQGPVSCLELGVLLPPPWLLSLLKQWFQTGDTRGGRHLAAPPLLSCVVLALCTKPPSVLCPSP